MRFVILREFALSPITANAGKCAAISTSSCVGAQAPYRRFDPTGEGGSKGANAPYSFAIDPAGANFALRYKRSFLGAVEKAKCGAIPLLVLCNPPLRLTLSSGEAAYRRAELAPTGEMRPHPSIRRLRRLLRMRQRGFFNSPFSVSFDLRRLLGVRKAGGRRSLPRAKPGENALSLSKGRYSG